MRRLFRTFLLLSLVTLFFVSCASATNLETALATPTENVISLEATIEPTSPLVIEGQVEPINNIVEVEESVTSSSIAKLVPIKRQVNAHYASSYLDVYNNTGYEISLLDVFTDAMYEENDIVTNLLGTDILSTDSSWYIDLELFPELAEAIFNTPEAKLYINAIDVEGDSYYKEWYPSVGELEVTLEFSDLIRLSNINEPETMGDFILFTNLTPYNFDQLYLQGGEESPNLLDFELLPGDTVRINTADVPWANIEKDYDLTIATYDTEGDLYQQEWFPSLSPWHIYFTMQDLNFSSGSTVSAGKMPLTFTNNTDAHIWYIYMATQEMFNEGKFGDDLLDMDVLEIGDSIKISSVSFPWVIDTLKAEEDPLFNVTAYDSEDNMYFRQWKPVSENWELTFENSDFVK